MNSVQRILEYIEKEEKEAAFDKPKAPENWPSKGEFECLNLEYRYRDDLPTVLHRISFDVKAKEKIGIVGRSGSGKSTLTLGMLRILEVEEGAEDRYIKIDGVDIKEMGLHELRRRVTIIPQDPILFTGTVKTNIDPFNEHTDEEIVDALKKAQIWDALRGTMETPPTPVSQVQSPTHDMTRHFELSDRNKTMELALLMNTDNLSKLTMKIDEGGSNLSVGQRQLLCMARAVIRKSKVLLMDEATANIDEYTDNLIQQMIKKYFKDATVIAIAHRLKSVIQYDRILVLERGNIAEFDTPLNLLDNEESIFGALVRENGADYEKELREMATEKLEEDQMSREPLEAVNY
jgi:ABC-type multidrug transport system fused ATPase/permease subunit